MAGREVVVTNPEWITIQGLKIAAEFMVAVLNALLQFV